MSSLQGQTSTPGGTGQQESSRQQPAPLQPLKEEPGETTLQHPKTEPSVALQQSTIETAEERSDLTSREDPEDESSTPESVSDSTLVAEEKMLSEKNIPAGLSPQQRRCEAANEPQHLTEAWFKWYDENREYAEGKYGRGYRRNQEILMGRRD